MTTTTMTRRCPERRRPVALVGFAVLVCACRCCCLDEAADSGPEDMEAGSSCPPGQVPCGNSSSSCLPRRLHCDGYPDCREGEDEKDCTDLHGGLSAVLGVLFNWSAHNISRTQDSSPRFSCNRTDVPKACYCDLHSKSRVFCQNSNLTQVPRAIPDVTRLTFTNNSMGILPSGAFYGYTNLTSLMIVNSITGIRPGAFRGLDMLRIMTIENNNISHIEANSFSGLFNLVWLTLKYNRLDVFDFDVLEDLRLLEILNMEGNGLKRIAKPFPELAYLTWLDLKRNEIEVIHADTFENLLNLEALILRENHLMDVHEEAFRYNTKMLEIDLAVNFLTFVRPGLFHGLRDLKKIDLSANAIKTLPVTLFHNLRSLNSLNLSGIEINNIEIRHFRHLPKLEFIYFKKFQYCSYAPYVRICAPKTDGLSSTEHLLVWPVLRLSVWVVALTTCAGNSVVLAWRLLSKKEDRVLSLFIRNLSVADFLMGVYLVTVGSLDVAFRDEYNKHAHQWMSSWHCTLCGLLAMVSCEVSVLILSLITVERYRCIKTNVRAVTVTAARYCLAIVWLLGLGLAVFPVVKWPQQRAFYSSNGLCFPLHIDDPFMLGWEYSAFVFLGVNFFAMVLIMGLYLSMFSIIREDRQRARPVTMKKQEDVVLALRFFFIVLTDCLCWIPIVIIKILALCEVRISENVYAWVVVFILPINSALNPVIYTLAAPTELRRRIEKFSQRILKCHKQIECMLTSNRTPRSSVATQSLTGTDIASASTDCTSAGGSYHPMARQSIAAIHELSESSEADDTVL
ncbi:relaxin receptor 1 [Dermacentor silvarum]|uniref:relaxin receptor 1 n=1 Tax=Dermacentor silvarum TaxID=543639 RepID=UPI002100C6FB|nr:relaxin receptor 1 [Dermacentor silvarum]